MSGFAVGSAPIGSIVDELRIITTPAEFTWVGIDAIINATLTTTPSEFSFVGEDSQIRITAISTPSEFSFESNDGIISAGLIATPPEFEFSGEQAVISAVLIAVPPEFEWEGVEATPKYVLITTPSEFQFVGVDADSSADGAIAVSATPSIFTWLGVDSDAIYDINITDIPDITVDLVGTTATISLENPNGTPIFIYKAPETKSGYTLLINTDSLPHNDTGITAGTSPKYKASFGITGNIGGSAVKLEGRKSTSRWSRNE